MGLAFRPRRPRRDRAACLARAICLGVLAADLLVAGKAAGDFADSFESAECTWELADADCGARLLDHRRDFTVARSGRASEHFRLAAEQGSYAYVIHEVTRARVIKEWSPRLWIRADRAGVQLLARVVLPRSRDPKTGTPLTALVRGDVYDRVGLWQQLTIRDVDQQLDRQVRVLRARFGPDVDPRESFLDLVVVNAYAGTGAVQLWLDDLEIYGHVPAPQFASFSSETPAGSTPTAGEDAEGLWGPLGERPAAVVKGTVIEAGGRPIFPRIIEENGEPLDWLHSLGFNAVRLQAPPTSIQLREASRLGLWLVSPPPPELQFSPAHDSVLAWDLGSGMDEPRLELARLLAGDVRRAETREGRPLVGEPSTCLWNYSRLLHFLVFDRRPIGSSLTLGGYGRWLQNRATLARPGTPWWAAIQTEQEAGLVGQWAAAGFPATPSAAVEAEQLRLCVYHAIASGARGLVFRSRTRMDGSAASCQLRALALRAVNLELLLIEPWLAAGSRSSETTASGDRSRVSVLQTERSQLVLWIGEREGQQFTRGGEPDGPVEMVLPSLATAPLVYALEPTGILRLPTRRVAGGVRFTMEGSGPVRLVALTQDSQVIHHLARTTLQQKADAARLHHGLALAQLESAEYVDSQLAGPESAGSLAPSWLAEAREHLRHSEFLLGASDHAAAYRRADLALERLGRVRRDSWERVTREFPAPVSSPFTVAYESLPWHSELARRLQASPSWSGNILPSGDFEQLDLLRASGWQNQAPAAGQIETRVELSPQLARDGAASLCLSAWTAGSGVPPAALEKPPIRILTPPLPVRRGQWLRIHGWVAVPQPLQASEDGLLIYDSLAGPALADRVLQTDGWREFAFYRVAPEDGSLTVAFELTGLGSAYVDDVSIELHDPAGSGR